MFRCAFFQPWILGLLPIEAASVIALAINNSLSYSNTIPSGAASIPAEYSFAPNPQFELAASSVFNPQMECYSEKCHPDLGRPSVAQNWSLWLGTRQLYGCVMSELVNCLPTWPNFIMGNVMSVKTAVDVSGITNASISAGAKRVRMSCWVYIVKGSVSLGYGSTGKPLQCATSDVKRKWVELKLDYDGAKLGPADQIVLYAYKGDTEFYVDAVSVTEI